MAGLDCTKRGRVPDLRGPERSTQGPATARPVPLDNNYKIREAFDNSYWPADYRVDGAGLIRHHHFGEGGYQESEREIQALLREQGDAVSASGLVTVTGDGAEAPAANDVKSPETYVGYDRAENFVSPGGMHGDVSRVFVVPRHIGLNQWGLAGKWTDRAEGATLDQAPGRIVYRFHARDLHLAPGPGKNGTAIRFRVTLDGHPLAEDHGADTDGQGAGRVTEQRL